MDNIIDFNIIEIELEDDEDEYAWQCDCGCQFFQILFTSDAFICKDCGEEQVFS